MEENGRCYVNKRKRESLLIGQGLVNFNHRQRDQSHDNDEDAVHNDGDFAEVVQNFGGFVTYLEYDR